MNQQRNVQIRRQSIQQTNPPILSSPFRQKSITVAFALLALIVLLALNHDDGKNSNRIRHEAAVEKGAIESQNPTVESRIGDFKENSSGESLNINDDNNKHAFQEKNSGEYLNVKDDNKEPEQNEEDENESHPWSWIGLMDTLADRNASFITSKLKDYSQNKTSYSTPNQFLTECNANKLPNKRCGFLGGPEGKFSTMPPHVMKVLRHLGMVESSRVLEVGVGLARNSQALVQFLDEGRYFGIEPNGDMLAVGVAHLIGWDVMEEKQPVFSTNSDFDFGVFFERGDERGDGEETEENELLFDVVTSRSVWSHTSKIQNEQYLSSFAKYSKPTAFLATSVIQVTEDCSRDYNGTEWVGQSHDGEKIGIVVHCMPWIRKACAKHGLVVKSLAEEAPELVGDKKWDDLGQPWIVIRHDSLPINEE